MSGAEIVFAPRLHIHALGKYPSGASVIDSDDITHLTYSPPPFNSDAASLLLRCRTFLNFVELELRI